MERSITENLLILFLLLPCMGATFWGFLWLINKAMGIKIKSVLEKIYENPIAAAIYRGSLIITAGQLVISGFERWV